MKKDRNKSIPIRSLGQGTGNGIAVAKVSSEAFQSDEDVQHAHRHDYHFFVLLEKGLTRPESKK